VEVQWDRLTLPLGWRKPAVIFANSTSDIFHEKLPWEHIASIYAVAVAAHHLRGHTTQILTKRPHRARELLNSEAFWNVVNAEAGFHVMERTDPLHRLSDDARATLDDYGPENPPPGVWLGTSVENQEWADKRRADFSGVPAAVRFVSYEPAIGAVDWTGWEFVDWIISGGESGRKARPSHPDWHRATLRFCEDHEVAYLFKQWGEWAPVSSSVQEGDYLLNTFDDEGFTTVGKAVTMRRLGKKAAGRLLDGIEHNGVPA
jgi:protein gp37